MFCPYCGIELKADARFCGGCGRAIAGVSAGGGVSETTGGTPATAGVPATKQPQNQPTVQQDQQTIRQTTRQGELMYKNPSTFRKIIYYINKIALPLMLVGVAGIVIGAITRDNAPIALIAVMFVIGIIGVIVHFVTRAVWGGMDIADGIKRRKND